MTDNRNVTEHPDFVQGNDNSTVRAEVTIKFGRGLIGDPFTSKNGKELVEVKIPNADKSDTRPWESFVISPRMIHDNQFGKGVWIKLPEDGTTRLSRMTKAGMDEAGKPVWNCETRTVSNSELKALMESYKDKTRGSVLSDLSGRKVQDTASKSFGRTANACEIDR